jgi:hypothetical protein
MAGVAAAVLPVEAPIERELPLAGQSRGKPRSLDPQNRVGEVALEPKFKLPLPFEKRTQGLLDGLLEGAPFLW